MSRHDLSSARPLHVGLFIGAASLDVGPHFFVQYVLERFRQLGHAVSIIDSRASIPSDLDAGILHVAATQVPHAIVSRLPAQLPIINRQVLDISKRRISRMLLRRADSYAGPVIVKSNSNFAGANDFARLRSGRKLLRRLVHRLLHRGYRPDAIPYQIYPSLGDVPRKVWADRRLVVEKFVPERQDSLYCLRKWVFLGDTNILILNRSTDPIVKAGDSSRDTVQGGVPQELMAERQRLGFDYGKFDYVMHAGRAVLLDANSTPGVGTHSHHHDAYAQEMAIGLERWVLARTLSTVGREIACAAS